MTIKQQGGIFGRNPTFNDVDVEGSLTVEGSALPSVGNIAVLDTAQTFTEKQTLSKAGQTFDIFNFEYTGAGDRITMGLDSYNSIMKLFSSNGSQSIQLSSGGANKSFFKGVDVEIHNANLVMATAGKGIDFSATSGTGTSELFDDYEEGSFSPNVDGSVTGTATYTRRVGKYIKVGAQVTAIIDVRWSAHTGAGTMYIKDLPFVGVYNAANITQSAAVGFYDFSIGAGYIPSLTLGNSSSTLLVARQPVGGGASSINNLPSSGTVVATITYMAA